ncbi:TPA: hypothetical protein ACPJ0R_004381 [Vibrio diabolicus]
MKNKLIFTFASIALVGCATVPLDPKVDVTEIQPFIEFNVNDSVSIVNEQKNDDTLLLVDLKTVAFTGSKKELTDTVIAVAEKELIKRKAIISPIATKQLNISVDKFSCDQSGSFSMGCETVVSVETEGQYKATYTAFGESAFGVQHASNYSLANAVSAMFRDPKIINYLTTK